MHFKIITYSFTNILMFVTCFSTFQNGQYKLEQKLSSIIINGTSNIHDWSIHVEQMRGLLNIEFEENKIKKIDNLKIIIPVLSLKSGKKEMDENVYKSLKTSQYSEINYILKNCAIENSEMILKGDITIAGITKTIKTKVIYQNSSKQIIFNGKFNIKMSDFGIKPPEYMLGTLKTNDNILIQFNFLFSKIV